MTIDPDDPDYTLRWPPDLLADEIRHLVEEARSGAVADDRWEQEVEALLRQAFVGSEPLQEFARQMRPSMAQRWGYDGEEPF